MKKQFLQTFGILMLISALSFGQNKQTIFPTADGSIYAGDKEQNYGTSNKLLVKRTATIMRHSFIKFDISQIKSGFQSAKLKIHINSVNGIFQDSIIMAVLQTQNNNWNEENLNWITAPKTDKTISNFYLTSKAGYTNIDLTAHIKNLLAKGEKEFGIRFSDPKSTGVMIEIASKEDKINKPFLEIQ
jgi:hypothetical protein